jgi:hypothetical protein
MSSCVLCRQKGKKRVQYQKLGGEALQQMRTKWHGTRFLIIDEVSMVSYETLEFIHRRLSEIYDVRGSDQSFCGLCVICVGDFFQLPPVQAPYTFHAVQPRSRQPQLQGGLPGELWKEFSAFHLTTNQRQKGDTTWAQHLNAIRDGRDEGALQEAMKALRTRLDVSREARGQVNVRDPEWADAPRCDSIPHCDACIA